MGVSKIEGPNVDPEKIGLTIRTPKPGIPDVSEPIGERRKLRNVA